jgi:hypothetical protein
MEDNELDIREYVYRKTVDLTGWRAWLLFLFMGALFVWLIAAILLGSHQLALWISGN